MTPETLVVYVCGLWDVVWFMWVCRGVNVVSVVFGDVFVVLRGF